MKFHPDLKTIGLFLILFLTIAGNARAQSQHAFRIAFTNKNGGTADIHTPSGFLSTKALARRSAQHISIDSADLPVSNIYVDSVVKLTGGVLHLKSRWLNYCVVLVDDTSDMQYVRGKDFVKSITHVATFSSPLHLLKTDGPLPYSKGAPYDYSTTLMRTTGGVGYYGDAYSQIALANGDYLHDRGYRGKGKIIAVLDAGFNLANVLPGFDSLRSSGRIVDTYNFNLDTGFVYDYSNHGTEVLSTMAGIINNTYVGTAPNASYALYVSESLSSEQPYEMDNMVAAIERADSIGADVVSISLGYYLFNIGAVNADLPFSALDGRTTVAAQATNKGVEKGMLLVVSAGNEGTTPWGKILTPGDADSAITVGSVTPSKTHTASSGKGPNAAGLLKPDVSMQGNPSYFFNTSGGVTAASGTSYATPELAGLAACLWEAAPTATPYMLRTAIKNSGHVAASPDNELGYGVPDFGKAAKALNVGVPPVPNGSISVSPNPFYNDLVLRLNVPTATSASAAIFDIQGRVIWTAGLSLQTGDNKLSVILPSLLPSGMYFLKLSLPGATQVLKLIKAPR